MTISPYAKICCFESCTKLHLMVRFQFWLAWSTPSRSTLTRSRRAYEVIMYWPRFRFRFNGISTFVRLFNAKAILLEEQQWYYSTHSWEDKGVRTFPQGICPKVNLIAQLEFELAYYDSAVHRFNHYITRTPPELVK